MSEEKFTLLVVEDDTYFVPRLKPKLEQLLPNAEVVIASTLPGAITALEQNSVNVLVTDMRYPGGQGRYAGLELLAHVKSGYPKIICVGMSSDFTPIIRDYCMANNVAMYEKGIGSKSFYQGIADTVTAAMASGNDQSPSNIQAAHRLEL